MLINKIITFLSRISIRLLIFNLLIVFVPIAASLYLKTYENQLLEALEQSMVQQGRLLSASLSSDELNGDRAREILLNLDKKTMARLRVVDKNGALLADSSIMDIPKKESIKISYESKREFKAAKNKSGFFNIIYKLSLYPIRFYRKYIIPPVPVSDPADFYSHNNLILGPEIVSALNGRYGAITRLSAGGQRSLTLYSAIPITNNKKVTGAVLVSQSTYSILCDLYEVRKDILKIFLITVVFAVIISILFDFTISKPIIRLKDEARSLIDKKGRLIGSFKESKRRDEIGVLARSLKELTRRLHSHISFIESFSADLSHEMKNPLASIRSAAEISLTTKDRKEQKRFLEMIKKDANRMERLLNGVREITKIDLSLDEDKKEKINPPKIIGQIVEGYNLRCVNQKITIENNNSDIYIQIAPERFVQIIENLLDNAISFSQSDDVVLIRIIKKVTNVEISIIDKGPGIEKENIDLIFNRFFSYRPGNNDKNKHTGLGLSIVKSIIEAYSGTISVKNNDEGGAEFKVILPIV